MIKLEAEGLQRTEIARRTGIGIASVYRVLAEAHRAAGDRHAAGVSHRLPELAAPGLLLRSWTA